MYLIDMEGKIVHEWTAKTAVQLLEFLPVLLCALKEDLGFIHKSV